MMQNADGKPYRFTTTFRTFLSALPTALRLRRLLRGLRNCDNNKAPSQEPEDKKKGN